MGRLESLLELTTAQPNNAFVWYGLAMEYRSQGKSAEAETTFRKLMSDFPDYVPSYHMAGQFFAESGRAQDAREALRRGIDAAVRSGNMHARGEMQSLLDSLP